MRLVRLVPIILAAVALAASSATAGSACAGPAPETDWCGCPLNLYDRAYVVLAHVVSGGYLLDAWVYAETNGIPHLQRGGAHPLLGYEDPCADRWAPPDLMLF